MPPTIAEIQEKKEDDIQQKYDVSNPADAEAARRQTESNAAKTLQRTYRGYRERRHMEGLSLDPASRWTEAIKEARYRSLTTPRSRADDPASSPNRPPPGFHHPSSAAQSKWNLAGSIARRANADEESSPSEADSATSPPDHDALSPSQKAARKQRKLAEKQERIKTAKTMDLSYFLEMVDVKHRYGSNLRKYHAEWKSRPTNENFFFWLDHGEAKCLDLANCSRKRLDDMQVRYLNREERMLYEVVVGEKGKLVWRKDGVKVDTTDAWRDSVEGIVKMESQVPLWADRPAFERGSSESSGVESEAETGAVGEANGNGQRGKDAETTTATPASANENEKSEPRTLLQDKFKLPIGGRKLQKKKGEEQSQSKKNKQKWIFVADTKNNLYIGIKQAGAFQHSSFLHGSRVSVAGLIHIRDGQLRILQPRSGHYRTPSHNLHIFIKSLQSRDVDMSVTAVGGSYAAMVGIEGFMKTRGRWRGWKEDVKGKVKGGKGDG